MANPSLAQLVNNVSNFNYYSGVGNFTAANVEPFNPTTIEDILVAQSIEGAVYTGITNLFLPTQSSFYPVSKDGSNIVDLLKGLTFGASGSNSTFPKLRQGDIYRSDKELFSYPNGNGILDRAGLGSRTSVYSYVSTFAAANAPQTVEAGVVSIPEEDMLNIDGDGNLAKAGFVAGNSFNFALQDFRAYKRAINADAFPTYQENNGTAGSPVYGGKAYQGTRIVLDTPANAKKYNIYSRLGIINTNNKDGYGTVYQDRINALSLYYGGGKFGDLNANGGTNDMNNQDVSTSEIRDLIKFRIKAIDNDSINNGVFMVFRAFLDGAITDAITPTWTPTKYVGRGESFYTYEGVTNSLTFSFTMVAFSRQEMMPLYQKITYLKSIMYPDYSSNKMRGTIVELTIGDYIKYQPGIINSLSITIPEDATWEIALNSPDGTTGKLDEDMHELPMMLKVQMEFIPIWNFLPQRSAHSKTGNYKLTPFIGIDKETSANNEWTIGTDVKGNPITPPPVAGSTPALSTNAISTGNSTFNIPYSSTANTNYGGLGTSIGSNTLTGLGKQ